MAVGVSQSTRTRVLCTQLCMQPNILDHSEWYFAPHGLRIRVELSLSLRGVMIWERLQLSIFCKQAHNTIGAILGTWCFLVTNRPLACSQLHLNCALKQAFLPSGPSRLGAVEAHQRVEFACVQQNLGLECWLRVSEGKWKQSLIGFSFLLFFWRQALEKYSAWLPCLKTIWR